MTNKLVTTYVPLKSHLGSTIVLTATITVDDALTDPTAVNFVWRVNPLKSNTTSAASQSTTGIWTVSIVPEESGNLEGYWQTTGTPAITQPVDIPIHPVQRAIY